MLTDLQRASRRDVGLQDVLKLVGQGDGDHHAAQVVEQAGDEGAFRIVHLGLLDQQVRHNGCGHRVVVETGHGPAGWGADLGPQSGHGEAQKIIAQLGDTEDGDGRADAAEPMPRLP